MAVKHLTGNEKKGILFAILYTFSTYRVIDGLYRFALGEFIAMTFLPLVFWGAYEVFQGNAKKWYLLSIGMSCLIWTHLLTASLVAGMLVVLLGLSFFSGTWNIERFKNLFTATICSTALNLGFLVTFFNRTSTNEMNLPSKFEMLGEGARRLATGMLKNDMSTYTVGLLVLAGLLYCTFNFGRLNRFNKLLLVLSAVILGLCTNVFPWKLVENSPFYVLQFPWRLNIFPTLFISYVFSDIALGDPVKDIKGKQSRDKIVVTAVSVCTIVLFMSSYTNLYHRVSNRVRWVAYNEIEKIVHQTYTQDYTPKGYHNEGAKDFYEQRLAQIKGKPLRVKEKLEPSLYVVEFTNHFDKDANVNLPIYYYKGGTGQLDGKVISVQQSSKNGAIQFHAAPGKHRFTYTYHYTWYEQLGKVISAGTICALGYWYRNEMRRYLKNE